MLSEKALIIGAGLALGAALAYVAARGVKDVTADAAGAAVGVVGDVIAGTAIGVGEVVGVPRTDSEAARRLMDEFDRAPWYEQAVLSLQISAYLTAGEYFKWVANPAFRP